jgi:ABC-2 type transport system ATP-binding protein
MPLPPEGHPRGPADNGRVSPATGPDVIETRGLRRSFKSGKRTVEAVAGVDLAVHQGEIFGFLGPNGAGKTTTLRMLSTLLPPSGGTARVAGCDLLTQSDRVRERIGYVGQAGGADREITGRRELVFQGRLYGLSTEAAKRRAAELIEKLELEVCADRKVGTYSGGQKRRLDIGLGLVHDPQLLFLDEPTTGLDPQSRARVWDEVQQMHERGITVFLTTHYLDEADALCDRIAIIDYGKIVAEGTPEELKRAVAGDVVTIGIASDKQQAALDLLRGQPFVREATAEDGFVRLYVDQGEVAMPAILRLLDGSSLQLRTMELHRPSLDDVFLRQTGRSLRETAA